MDKGVLKTEAHYMAFINGVLIDNNKNKKPPIVHASDRKTNKTAMRPFWHYFDETVKKIRLTHVWDVTLRVPKRALDA